MGSRADALNEQEAEVHAMRVTMLEELRTLTFLRSEFPMLADWGVEDFDHTIHSLGLNYLTALGRKLGFWAVSEYPVRRSNVRQYSGSVRCDVTWLMRPSGAVVLLGEFERYGPTKQRILRRKAENLAAAHHLLAGEARLLVLAVWTTSSVPVHGLRDLPNHVRGGFLDPSGNRVPPLPANVDLLTPVFVLHPSERGLVLREVLV